MSESNTLTSFSRSVVSFDGIKNLTQFPGGTSFRGLLRPNIAALFCGKNGPRSRRFLCFTEHGVLTRYLKKRIIRVPHSETVATLSSRKRCFSPAASPRGRAGSGSGSAFPVIRPGSGISLPSIWKTRRDYTRFTGPMTWVRHTQHRSC